MQWLGIDIGGANLKLADGRGFAESRAFALWQEPHLLAQQLRTLIAEAPPSDHLAVTMTGELADCFETKAEGVRSILDAVREAADGRHTRVYLTSGMMVTPQVAVRRPSEAAAANWHALARFAGRFAKNEAALVVDLGSTTCDIVPLQHGQPATQSRTDTDRLLSGELIYTGVERSPVCAVANTVPYRGQHCPLAQEVFATTRDVYVILGDLAEDAGSKQTPDGRPATKAASRVRLGRMICADAETFNHRDAVAIAQAVAETQEKQIAASIRRVAERLATPPMAIILSGQGEFLAQRALETLKPSWRVVSLSRDLGPLVSRCGPAHALAVLAREAAGA